MAGVKLQEQLNDPACDDRDNPGDGGGGGSATWIDHGNGNQDQGRGGKNCLDERISTVSRN